MSDERLAREGEARACMAEQETARLEFIAGWEGRYTYEEIYGETPEAFHKRLEEKFNKEFPPPSQEVHPNKKDKEGTLNKKRRSTSEYRVFGLPEAGKIFIENLQNCNTIEKTIVYATSRLVKEYFHNDLELFEYTLSDGSIYRERTQYINLMPWYGRPIVFLCLEKFCPICERGKDIFIWSEDTLNWS